jgi:hypothetical protein
MDFIYGLVFGAFIVGLVFYFYRSYFIRNKTEEQSAVLLEKIRNVSKLITVESDFSEIMHYADAKNILLNLVSSQKKAILLANSKVMVGFDMKQIRIQPDPKKKLLTITHFPDPKVLSIETDVEYYDVRNGLFNKFEAKDLTQLNRKIKENIESKISQSGVLQTANNKALKTVKMIEQIVETFGWKLTYDELQLYEQSQISREKEI